MLRNVDLSEISDGKLYHKDDSFGCPVEGCENCYACCSVTSDTIVLDPYDCAMLSYACQASFDAFMEQYIGLRPVDGLILPYLKKKEKPNGEETCVFLNEEKRCIIHAARPGICRMFPLGRVYDSEEQDFAYILQTRECPRVDGKTFSPDDVVCVREWLDIPQIERYEQFVKDWHFLLKDLETVMHEHPEEEFVKKLCMAVLNLFYRRPYGKDFYADFDDRLAQMREIIRL